MRTIRSTFTFERETKLPESVHEAGISMLGQIVPDEEHEDFSVCQFVEHTQIRAKR